VVQGSSPPARGYRSRPTSEMGRWASSPGGDWVRWWRREELRRAPAARPRLCGRRGPDSGEVRWGVGQLRAVEGLRSPRDCVCGAGCHGDGRGRRHSGGGADGAVERRRGVGWCEEERRVLK
jgi:hypothetical protein